jgi:hypothetical protein
MNMGQFQASMEAANHQSATKFIEHVTQYINDEIKAGAIIGPIKLDKYSEIHVSPLINRPKGKTNRRIIVDISYPWLLGKSVNSAIVRTSISM